MLVVGVSLETSRQAVALAAKYEGLYASVGIQPNYVAGCAANDWDEIQKLALAPKVIALGETGLDRYWNDTPFPMQQDSFAQHLQFSQASKIPFIVHMRDCGNDILAMLQAASAHGQLHGVMHSFTGNAELAHACLELGMYISFAGMVTYKKSDELRAIAKMIPSDRILIETDAPYLSPHPVRGQRPNEPALLVHTAACLAEVRGTSLLEFACQTYENACHFLKLPL
jgi:TatD DNase family protein